MRRQSQLTDKRKEVFLQSLAATGSTVAAAQTATPWANGEHGGLSTFRDEAKRDPYFALAWEKAEEAALAKVESEIMRRAMEPTRRLVVSKGEIVGYDETYDNKLLLAVARRLNPDAWSERKQIEHSGEIGHRHTHAVLAITPQDILLLPKPEQQQIVQLLMQLGELKEANGRSVPQLSAPASVSQQ